MEQKPLHVEVMRSQLGRVQGLGAARSGVAIWWLERVTSIALVPLTLWLIFCIFTLLGKPQMAVREWASMPVNTVLLLAMVLTTFRHMQLGLQVVIEDYVHQEGPRVLCLLLVKFCCALLALACTVAIFKLAF